MARVCFGGAQISAIVTTVGDRKLSIDDEKEKFGFDDNNLRRLKKTIGLDSRYVVSEGICTSDLCYQSAVDIFRQLDIDKKDVEALLLVTQSPDYRAPSTAIIMQERLGLSVDTLAYDINLGCSGFVYGLFTAFSFIQSGLKKVLLLVGDVASSLTGRRDKALAPLMGDAGSAILIDRVENQKSYFVMHSDGSGYQHLIIPGGACRKPYRRPVLSEDRGTEDTDLRSDMDMYMNGGEIFNFSIKVVPKLFQELFEFARVTQKEIDYFVLHQPNKYILQNIAKRLGLGEEKLPSKTASVFGNQNSASIPGTINGFLYENFSNLKLKNIFVGFGIGLSWGACYVETSAIYTPQVKTFDRRYYNRSGS